MQHEDENFKLQVGWSQDVSINPHQHQLKVNICIYFTKYKWSIYVDFANYKRYKMDKLIHAVNIYV